MGSSRSRRRGLSLESTLFAATHDMTFSQPRVA